MYIYMHMQVEYVKNERELHKIAKQDNANRCGATDDPNDRKYGYSRSSVGKTGTMYCLQVDNQYKKENELLNLKDWRDNVQKSSNVGEKKGYVYVLVDK